MSPVTHVLNFHCEVHKLTKDANLIFTFRPPVNHPLSDRQNRAAWKVVLLKKGDPDGGKFTIELVEDFAFSTVQLTRDGIIMPQLSMPIKHGQHTILEQRGTWRTPTDVIGDNLQARNGTDVFQDIAVGTVVKKGPYIDLDPTFLFRVGSGSTITTKFCPTLLMYCTMDYQKNSLMTTEISRDLFWEQDLSEMDPVSDWRLEEIDGVYTVTRI